MSKELFEKMQKYENVFYVAIYGKYYRALDSLKLGDIVQACKEMNIYIKTNCPTCMLKALQTLGKAYYAYKEEQEKIALSTPEIKIKETIKPEKKVCKNASKAKKKGK